MYSVVAKHLDSDWPRFQYSLKSHHAGVVTVSDGVSLDYTRLFCILSSENGRQRIQANPWGDGQTLGGMGKPVGGRPQEGRRSRGKDEERGQPVAQVYCSFWLVGAYAPYGWWGSGTN